LLVCSPEYASALPGAFKNLLEWTIGDASTYEKPIAAINVAANGAVDAHESLRKVLGKVHARIVESAWSHIPVARSDVNPSGTIDDPAIRAQLRLTLDSLVADVRSGPTATHV
jgi:NAD(P)H-dependent FMN reductase